MTIIPPRFPFKIKNRPDAEGFTLISRHHECDEDNARLRSLVMKQYRKDTPCASCKSTCYDKCVRIDWGCSNSMSMKTHPLCDTCCSSIVGKNKCLNDTHKLDGNYQFHWADNFNCPDFKCEWCQSMIEDYAY